MSGLDISLFITSVPLWVLLSGIVLLALAFVLQSRGTRFELFSLSLLSFIIGFLYALLYPAQSGSHTTPTPTQLYLHQRVASLIEPSVSRSFMEAITIGYKGDIDPATRQIFQRTGTSHLLAISGYHITLVCFVIFFLIHHLFPTIRQRRIAHLATALPLWGYAGILGFQPSMTRAVLMFSVFQIADLLERGTESLHICILTATMMLIVNPSLICNVGFQLTFAAVLGIFLLYVPLSRHTFRLPYRLQTFLAQTVLLSLSCTLFTLPITGYHFGNFSLIGPLTNILANIFTPVLLSLSILWWGASAISTELAHALWFVIDNTFAIFYRLMEWFSGFRASTFFFSPDLVEVLLIFLPILCLCQLVRQYTFRNIMRFLWSLIPLPLYFILSRCLPFL